MGIYYFLVNQAQIIEFADNRLEIATQAVNLQIREQISELLLKWTGRVFNVIIAKKSAVESLKSRLVGQAKQSPQWRLISRDFPGASIDDIVLR